MLAMKFKRIKDGSVSLKDWELGICGSVSAAVENLVQDSLDVVFSDDGADCEMQIRLFDDGMKTAALISINEFDAVAKCEFNLIDFIRDECEEAEPEDRASVADQLRKLADELCAMK